ncbi:MAG: thioredoxin domain-containing protein [Deltaproteobacteria bacterium]|nr:thioredoxin domain-containing protein [Deltaproteobacteria bacterium]
MSKRFLAPLAFALLLPMAALAEDEVVATVGDKNITRAELEKSVRAQLVEADSQRYDILSEGLESLISERLLEAEATAKGTTTQALQQELMTAPVDEPTQEQIQKVFDDNKASLSGQTLDQVKDRIVDYLKGQQRAAKAQTLLAELRKKYPTVVKLSPPVVEVSDAGREARGPATAAVTIVAFSDYECPFCKRAETTVEEVVSTYGDKIRYVHRDYPLPFHKHARGAAESARCAGDQGKFWEMNNALFKAEDLSPEKIGELATTLGLDKTAFDACVSSGKFKTMIDEDMAAGGEAGVNGTPAFFINGRMLSGAQPFERFKTLIDAELAKAETK